MIGVILSRKKYLIKATTFDKRGVPIATGINDYKKSSPIMKQLAARVGLHDKIYLHAEVLAILRSGDRKISSIYIERYNTDGSPALAKPCPVCQEAIKLWGIKNVFYTEGE